MGSQAQYGELAKVQMLVVTGEKKGQSRGKSNPDRTKVASGQGGFYREWYLPAGTAITSITGWSPLSPCPCHYHGVSVLQMGPRDNPYYQELLDHMQQIQREGKALSHLVLVSGAEAQQGNLLHTERGCSKHVLYGCEKVSTAQLVQK